MQPRPLITSTKLENDLLRTHHTLLRCPTPHNGPSITHPVTLHRQSRDIAGKVFVIVHAEWVVVDQHVLGAMVIAKPRPWKGGAKGARHGLVQDDLLVAGVERVDSEELCVGLQMASERGLQVYIFLVDWPKEMCQ